MHLEANLPVIIFKERNRFIAYTPALDISTSGKTFNQVRKNFSILINLFMQESIKKGTLNEVLEEAGWAKVNNEWHHPMVISHETIPVRI